MAARKTPVMQQHAAAKRAYPEAIVFFRLGDFYEMFGDDAIVCARELELTLTSRNKGKPDEIPMAGVPHHSAHGYIGRLLRRGYQVAICEQMADPATVKGIVPRQVVRILTPGLVTHQDHLEAASNNWLGALELGTDTVAIALFDLSTGELKAAEVGALTSLLAEVARYSPREVLVGQAPATPGEQLDPALDALGALDPRLAVRRDPELSDQEADRQLEQVVAGGFGPTLRRAAARALRFARASCPGIDLPVRRLSRFDPSTTLTIDETAQRHLELAESNAGDGAATLLSIIDSTRSPPGARLLKSRLLAPLTNIDSIRRRHDELELFVVHSALRKQLREQLGRVGDLERLAVRAALGESTPRDLGQLRSGLTAAGEIVGLLADLKDGIDRETLGADAVDPVSDVAAALGQALVERPPSQPKDGAIFQDSYDTELRELAELKKSGTEHIVALEARLKEELGIGSLKVRFTRVFGWYVEVSRSQLSRVPEDWRRKQTVAGGERYTLDALDELAERIAHAEERHRARELELLRELVEQVQRAHQRIFALSESLARWDCAAALAEVAHRYDYVRPRMDSSLSLAIEDGRHPVVERLAAAKGFVPNSVELDCDAVRLWMVTGPNMAGKSTLLRQTALITILAQMCSFVPAKAARIGVVDRILSRVGASDNLSRGESTFMVEMRETAEILRSATRRSLVIVDEIGRGTSTFDGLAIAWAVAEYLDEVVECRALFATHYHELTELADASASAANHSVSARELGDDIVFLHRLVQGPASKSYGVAVAKLAGLPASVLARAQALLQTFEDGSAGSDARAKGPRPKGMRDSAATRGAQLALFQPRPEISEQQKQVLATLEAVDTDQLTPLEALQLVARLKGRL